MQIGKEMPPKEDDQESPSSEQSEGKDVQMIDQAIEQIKSGDMQGAISTLESLKGNEQAEVEEGPEPKETMEDSVNKMFANNKSPM